MKSNFSLAVSLMLFLSSCASTPTSSTADAQPAGSPSPNSISIDASQSIQFPMTAKEKKKLQADFKKASANERQSLAKNEKAGFKSLSISQAAAKKAWHAQEKSSRRIFFEQHMSGPERRQYIQDYLKRKTEFDKSQKDEVAAAKVSWGEKREYLTKLQKDREVQFNARLNQNQRPDASLWPKE